MTRKFLIRHLTRDKADQADPQTPTMMGEVEALTMGIVLRREFGVQFERCISSPKARAVRTAELIFSGVAGWNMDVYSDLPDVETDDGLEDFSSDPRFQPLKADLKKIKGCAEIESEQAIFLATGALAELRQTKLDEAIKVVDGIEDEGDILVGGLHGATIDGLYAHYAKMLGTGTKDGMSAFGRQIGKCEGFVLVYNDQGELSSIQKIERPAWLNAVAALIGGGGD